MKTGIKLCGLSRPCDIETANELRPDYVGFVFAKKSPRCVSAEQALRLKEMLAPGIRAVGVFVNEPAASIAALLRDGIIDLAQLHGTETEEDIRALRALTDKPVIQAFSVGGIGDIARAERSSADYVLLDSGAGGTGETFDWSLLSAIKKPYFLAGGLTPENVGDALKALKPFSVDVSTGIETDGKKDPRKMRDFVFAVRGKEEQR